MNHARFRLAAATAFFFSSTIALSYSSGPPLGKTGAPGESTCRDCHSDFPLNSGNGKFDFTIPPPIYKPGENYTFWVKLQDPGQRRWGFQLTSLDPSNDGAGDLSPGNSDSTAVQTSGGRQYLAQKSLGTWRGVADGPVTWRVEWQAPLAGTGPVTFYAAGNAANNDGDTDGDYIYTMSQSAVESTSDLDLGLEGVPAEVVRGGRLQFSARITNRGQTLERFDAAGLEARGPVPPVNIPLYSGGLVPVQPGSFVGSPVTVNVPGVAPTGSYGIVVSITRAGQLLDAETFLVNVVP